MPGILAILTSQLETGAPEGSALEGQLCFYYVWSPQWEKPSAQSCNNHVKCEFPLPKNNTLFSLTFPWGKLPLRHLLGSLLILAIPHQRHHLFFNICRQFHKPAQSVVLKIIKSRLRPRAGQSAWSPVTIVKALATSESHPPHSHGAGKSLRRPSPAPDQEHTYIVPATKQGTQRYV